MSSFRWAACRKKALDSMSLTDSQIMRHSLGEVCSQDGFCSWRSTECKSASVIGVTFDDLHRTAVSRLALAGATEAEIATITGQSLRDVRSILDAHYLNRDPRLAENAIRKLEARTQSSK